MSNGHRWSKFWWADWQNDPALKVCGHLAKGVWMDLLCLMAQAEPVGHLVINGHAPAMDEIGVMIGMGAKQLEPIMQKLERNGVFSRTSAGVIFCRRMVRDAAASEAGREHIAKRWNGASQHPPPNTPPNTPPNRGPTEEPNRQPKREANSPPKRAPTSLYSEAEAEAEAETEGVLTHSQRARTTPPVEGNLVGKKAKHPLPTDWEPSAKSLLHASILGLDAESVTYHANQMRAWAWAKNYPLPDWDWRFDRWLETEARKVKLAAQETKSVHQQIREEFGGGTFLHPTKSYEETVRDHEEQLGVRLTAIAGGKS